MKIGIPLFSFLMFSFDVSEFVLSLSCISVADRQLIGLNILQIITTCKTIF